MNQRHLDKTRSHYVSMRQFGHYSNSAGAVMQDGHDITLMFTAPDLRGHEGKVEDLFRVVHDAIESDVSGKPGTVTISNADPNNSDFAQKLETLQQFCQRNNYAVRSPASAVRSVQKSQSQDKSSGIQL